jgi:hypothetical protein
MWAKDLNPIAFEIACQRSTTEVIKPPGKNWGATYASDHPEIQVLIKKYKSKSTTEPLRQTGKYNEVEEPSRYTLEIRGEEHNAQGLDTPISMHKPLEASRDEDVDTSKARLGVERMKGSFQNMQDEKKDTTGLSISSPQASTETSESPSTLVFEEQDRTHNFAPNWPLPVEFRLQRIWHEILGVVDNRLRRWLRPAVLDGHYRVEWTCVKFFCLRLL